MPFATAKDRIEIFTGPDLHEAAIPMKNGQIWANVGYGRPYTVASCMASTNIAARRHYGTMVLDSCVVQAQTAFSCNGQPSGLLIRRRCIIGASLLTPEGSRGSKNGRPHKAIARETERVGRRTEERLA